MRNLSIGVMFLMVAAERDAPACGGLFCDQSTVTQPPEQSSERIVFVANPADWTVPPEGMIVDTGDPPDLDIPAGTLTTDVYVEIAYEGAAESFAWVVPLLEPPVLIGTASKEIFDDLDLATAPRFTFIYGGVFAQADGGGGFGCGADSEASAGGSEPAYTDPEVTVLSYERVGPYQVAVIESDDSGALRDWLLLNGYQIPPMAAALLDTYVSEGKVFAAFRLADGKGVGAIEPVVIRVPGNEPCIPLRLTPIASVPVLSVTALVFGEGRARATNYGQASVDYDAVRPTSPTSSDYSLQLRAAATKLGGRAFETEFAGWSDSVPATAHATQALLARGGFVTRLSARIAPGEMTLDPIFEITDQHDQVFADHVVDITGDDEAIEALGVSASGGTEGEGEGMACASAGRPLMPLWPLWSLLGIALILRPRRR